MCVSGTQSLVPVILFRELLDARNDYPHNVAGLCPSPHASLLMSSYSSHASLPLSGPSVKLTWA